MTLPLVQDSVKYNFPGGGWKRFLVWKCTSIEIIHYNYTFFGIYILRSCSYGYEELTKNVNFDFSFKTPKWKSFDRGLVNHRLQSMPPCEHVCIFACVIKQAKFNFSL